MVSLEIAEAEMARRGKVAEGLIADQRPELLSLFFTYQNEAVAARKFLDISLIELNAETKILEVGGGILALAIQLASEGFKVTTVEPIGAGFTGISFMMDIFMEIAREENVALELIQSPIEECEFDQKFDFIFSINVMEHLKDPYIVLFQIVLFLKQNGKYRFFCPNYDFPYEPHFGKWIFARRNEAFHLKSNLALRAKTELVDSDGLYESINFLTLRKLRLFLEANELEFQVNRNAFYEILVRSISDSGLQARHRSLHSIVLFIEKLGLLQMAKIFPPNFQPIIDITVTKIKI
jgi:2-polyprenyl-3-methyl-5-hydroxy-6-metoxy-1,4-benzoquinol methylase